MRLTVVFSLMIVFCVLSGCYLYSEPKKRGKVLLSGIDMGQTLKIAEMELKRNYTGSVLTIWAIRDQKFSAEEAGTVSSLYLKYIGRVDSEEQKARGFSVWHLTWAISNIYRQGDEEVRQAILPAYQDAKKRVEKADSRMTNKFFKEEKIYMGDAHFGGRRYAKKHIVVPGNRKYLQSVSEYTSKRKNGDEDKNN